MHRLENDNVWRGPTDSVFFNKKRESVHNLALRLEKFGVTTYGTNTELEAELKVGKRKITIIPSWRYDEYGSDDYNDKYDVDISIPALDVTIPIRLSKFKKTFNKDSYLMKAIDEYEASLSAARAAFANNIETARMIDEADDA